MCDKCVDMALKIDPLMIELMASIEPEYKALEVKLADAFKALMKTEIVNESDEPFEPTHEQIAQLEIEKTKLMGIIGVAHALGWMTAMQCENVEDMGMHVRPLIHMLHQGLNDGNAYRYVHNMRKH